MKNPWEEITLRDYESHMKLDSVFQLQTLNRMMEGQIGKYNVSSIMILGIAGGNGLEYIDQKKISKVYGVDINREYLKECKRRFRSLKELECLNIDLTDETINLPQAELLIADLFIEYIGYACFQKSVLQCKPLYVSCIIQKNTDESFVSASPYLHVFNSLEQIHHSIFENELNEAMQQIGYHKVLVSEEKLPNGKSLIQLDYIKEE